MDKSVNKRTFNSKILCSNCNRPLSVGPIYMYENIGTFCGRCPSPTAQTSPIRVTIYEKLASRFNFPCSNQLYGCNYSGMFNEIAKHENNCPKQMISCPMSEKWCNQSYTIDGIFKHFKENHVESVLFKTVWDCDVKNESLYIYFMQQACLLFQGELIGENFHFFVSFIGTTEDMYEKYNLLVLSSDGKRSLVFDGNLICEHDTKNVDYCVVSKESLDCLLSTTNSKILRLMVSLVRKEANYLKSCQLCGKKLVSEVKLCCNGHDFCENCAITNNFDCKLCIDVNNSPQKQTTFYINLNNQISYDCPLNEQTKCGFHSTVNKIIEHFIDFHKNIYKEELPNAFKLIKEQPVVTEYFYLNKKLFIFNAVYNPRKIKFSMTLFSDNEEKNYSLVLDFKKNGKSFQFIEPISMLNESKDESETYLELHEHMLRPFIEKDSLSFVFSIQNLKN